MRDKTNWLAGLVCLYSIALGGYAGYLLLGYCDGANHCLTGQPLPPFSQLFEPVVYLGIIGGCLHGIASVVYHKGKNGLEVSWWAFYAGQPFIGAGMALATALVLVSGVMGFKAGNELVVLAWAALAGLYSQPALDKLKDIFATIFKV